tara:strand:+ start:872 stop:1375 length:504 start_codon:yes stop_codon:yes gene_type:complete
MSNFYSTEPVANPQAINATSTTQKLPLGTIVRALDKADTAYGVGEFIYLSGLASTAVGEVVVYNADDFSTKLAVENDIGPVATSMSINLASQYGWYQISGKGVALVSASFADDANCYLTATAGTMDDNDVSGDQIRRMKGASAIGTPSTGLAEVEMSRPEVNDLVDN